MLALSGGPPVVPPATAAPWPEVTAADRAAILRAIDKATPWHWPMEVVLELEQEWSRYTGMDYVLAANSGTAALHMAVTAAKIEPGDEVLVPADTFLATASCVLHANAVPIFVDTDYETFNIDSAKIAEKITRRTKAIIAVDLNGLPADYEQLMAIARRHDLLIIEDASQAHGATYQGRPVGGLADMSGASLNGSKCLSALGEGGLFATKDEYQFRLARRTLMFGEELTGQGRQYNSRMMGWNYRIDVLGAAFACSQLNRLAEMSVIRQENGRSLTEALAGIPGIRLPVVPPDRTHVYFFYPLLVQPEDLGIDLPVDLFRDTLENALRAEGLEVMRWQPQPVPYQTLFQEMRGYGKGCPWTCPHARPGISYAVERYPVAKEICLRRLVLGQSFSSLGPPNDERTMKLYAQAFYKVLVDERSAFIDAVRREARHRLAESA